MGSRLHGNDGRRGRESTAQSSFPRTRGGRRRWVPVSTGTTNPRPHIVIPAHGGNPRRGGRRWVPVSTGTTGGHSRIRRESTAPHRHSRAGGNPTAGGRPAAMGSRLHGNDGRTHNRHSRHGANPRPNIVIPARRESTAGGRRRWVPVSTGTTDTASGHPQSSFPPRRESTAHDRHSRAGGNPRRGAGGDGFPSPRERRAGTGAPTIVIPATAGIHGPSSFPRRRESTAGGGGDGFPSPRERRAAAAHPNRHSRHGAHGPNRHSRAGGNPRRGAGDGFPSPRERRGTQDRHSRHGGVLTPPPRPRRHSRAGGNPRPRRPVPRERRRPAGVGYCRPL